jgi:hypothetical protein
MGLLDAFGLTNNLRSGSLLSQGGNFSIPQFGGGAAPAVAQAPVPSVMPSSLGSGNSNFQGFNPTAFANIAPQLLTPSNSPQQQALSRQAGMPGGKLNCIG